MVQKIKKKMFDVKPFWAITEFLINFKKIFLTNLKQMPD